jgi:hypothetical protein
MKDLPWIIFATALAMAINVEIASLVLDVSWKEAANTAMPLTVIGLFVGSAVGVACRK